MLGKFRLHWYTGYAYSQHAAGYADVGHFQAAIRCSRIAIHHFRRADKELQKIQSYKRKTDETRNDDAE